MSRAESPDRLGAEADEPESRIQPSFLRRMISLFLFQYAFEPLCVRKFSQN